MTNPTQSSTPTSEVCCLTALRLSQLPEARVLASCLKRLHPDWHLIAAIAGPHPEGLDVDPAAEPFDEVIWSHAFSAIMMSPPDHFIQRDAERFRTGVKGLALKRLSEAHGRKTLYLDPGVAVLNSLAPVVNLLDSHAIVVVPHRLVVQSEYGRTLANGNAARDGGVFAPGCIAFRAAGEGARFAAALSERLLNSREEDPWGSSAAEESWLDQVPVLFDGVHILKDPGWHVSSRNLDERDLTFDEHGRLLSNGHVLRTFDASDVRAHGEQLRKDATPMSMAVHDVLCWYRHAVTEFADPSIPPDGRGNPPGHKGSAAGGSALRPVPSSKSRRTPGRAGQGLTHTRYGPMRCFLDGDLISRFLRHYGEWAHFETSLLGSMHCSRIFDIGAYLGTFSLAMSASKPNFILAVEANPETYELLRGNLARNLRAHHATVNAAVMQGSGKATGAPSLADNHGSFSVRGGTHTALGPVIPTRTLAELRAEFGSYDLLKLDVEGSERDVIRSDAAWIVQHKPVIWAECNEHPDSLSLFDLLKELGYEVHYYRYPVFNPDNFNGNALRLVPAAFEAGLLAVAPGVNAHCPRPAAREGAGMVQVTSAEELRRALWLTPRRGEAGWDALSSTERLALLARQAEGGAYSDFLLASNTARPASPVPAPAAPTQRNVGENYRNEVLTLLQVHDEKDAMARAVGGQFEAIGLLEYCVLRQHGLHDQATVIDVGCGSGRLAVQLKDRFAGRYVGIDVVPELLAYARKLCARPEWSFYLAPGLAIPEPDNSADFVCFFSVFTHLLHEESFTYLKDAKRVCKPGGKIIFSFLEFRIASQWPMFELALADARPDKVLNQFMGRDAIEAWADRLGLEIIGIWDGDKPHIHLLQPDARTDATEVAGKGSLGQSLCVLTNRASC